MKKVVSTVLCFVLVAMMVSVGIVSASASTGGHSQSDAVSWVKSQNGKALDYDGAWGAQCVDLIMYYYQYLGNSSPGGNAKDYTWNALPSGWTRTSSPSAGDIVVWGAGAYMGKNGYYADGTNGHIGIVTAVSGSNMDYYDQNAYPQGQKVGSHSGHAISSAATFIHPDFQGSSSATIDLGTNFYAFIMNKSKWKPLTVEKDNNVVIRSEKSDRCADQVWKFERQGDGSYKIISTANRYCLDVNLASNESGANVKVWEDTGHDAQRWYIYGDKNSRRFVLKAKCTNCVLDVYGNNSDDGTNVQMYSQHNGDSEIFDIYGLDNCSFAANMGTNFKAPFLNKNGWKILQNDENNNVSIQKETGISRDVWKFTRQSDGSYIISSCYDGKNMDIYGNSMNAGANVGTYDSNGNDNQRWYFYEYDGGYLVQSKRSGKFIDLTGGYQDFGTNVQVWDKNCTYSQVFSVYRSDECKLCATQLSAKVNNQTIDFDWTSVYGETGFNLRIWKDKCWEGDSFKDVWNIPANSTTEKVKLPTGKYEAYIDTFDHFDVFMSNIISFEVKQGMIGDVNGDNNIDVLDAALVQKYASGKADLTADQITVADVNGDNNVDVLDAAEIQKFAAGIITEFKKKA